MKTKVVVLVLFLVFFLSGIAKLTSLPFEVEAFERWGYPLWFMYLTGFIEIIGAAALLIPRVSAVASLVLAGLMVGAVATHLMHGEWLMLIVATAILVTALYRTCVGREQIRTLIGRSPKSPD
ncbi:DoxX family protein [Kangiella shandongensis]|uniref:DoxX family protein n=1 Tax=Kangiella shandongensis TaxID=2763258 RepID=UPI001CBE179E|nr:DoxX family protein [Kangiella shandongensis]